jgi:hypothetical protein
MFLIALAALFAGVGCNSVRPLAGYSSAESLAVAVLDALARKDVAKLEALALNEQEFRDHVWPDLPAARPERNLPFSYVWGDLRQKSRGSLMATLEERGGQRYELHRVTFAGETSYPHYTVHRQATFHVRDGTGAVTAIRVCGSMIEKEGAWMLFSYVVD